MCSCFQHAYKSEKIESQKGQIWFDMLTQINQIIPDQKQFKIPSEFSEKIRYSCYKIYSHSFFQIFIFIVVIINLIIMTLSFEGSDLIYIDILDSISSVCVLIFTLEAIIKIIALKDFYFKDAWNKFDFLVVLIGILELLIILSIENLTNIGGLLKTLQVIKILRVVRVIR